MAGKFLPPLIYRDQLSQIIFTLKQVTSIIWKINPRFTFFIFALSAFWGLLTFPAFFLEKLILDRIVENIGNPNIRAAVTPIAFLVVGRILIEAARNILSSIMRFLRTYASRAFNMHLDVMLATKLATLDASTLEDPKFQDRYNKVERESGRRAWGLMMPLVDIPNYVAGLGSTIVILWFLHPLIALGLIVVSLPHVWVDRGFIKKEYDFEGEMANKYRLWWWLGHYLTRTKSFLELRILTLQNYLTRRMQQIQSEILSGHLVLSRSREKARNLAYLPQIIFYIGVNTYLVILAVSTKITIGSYELFLRSLLSAIQNFTALANSFLEIYENYIFVADLTWFLNLKPRIKKVRKGKRPEKIKKGIQFRDVWFKYKENGQWILRGVNTVFVPGERVAIVGENGSGKSTLIKILTRFYDPQKGEVLVDGVNIREMDYSFYQRKFAVLFQDFETYPFSAKETIAFGDVRRINNLESVKASAAQTGIHEYIENLPLRYKNPLNPQFPKGVEPSGGQWQRFGISRMLFRKDAEILILDEPTSNVDPEAEEKIFNELLKISKSKILIFVSQRFSTVRRADNILVVDKGRITEQGTHEELMGLEGKYSKLFKLQAKGYQ